MTTYDVPHPPIVSREHWLVARKKLLAQEKELTKQYDRVNAVRRRLPMVKIEKSYLFDGPGGEESLLDLFKGRRQLVVHVRSLVGERLPGLHRLRERHRRSQHAGQMRHHLRDGVARAAQQARSLQGAPGLAFRVGSLARQRVQLRLSRHKRREDRAGRIQLSQQGRV